jgi:hypothetical protein
MVSPAVEARGVQKCGRTSTGSRCRHVGSCSKLTLPLSTLRTRGTPGSTSGSQDDAHEISRFAGAKEKRSRHSLALTLRTTSGGEGKRPLRCRFRCDPSVSLTPRSLYRELLAARGMARRLGDEHVFGEQFGEQIESNSDALRRSRPARSRRPRVSHTRSLGLGAGRSQVQILSPRLERPCKWA